MYDFFSLEIPPEYASVLLKNSELNFVTKVNTNTGEIILTEKGYNLTTASFKDFNIYIYQKENKQPRIEIKGSFHKSYEGGTNYKDFYFDDFVSEVNAVCDFLKLQVQDVFVHSFEFGVNLKPPLDTNLILEGLKSISRTKFERRQYSNEGLYVSADFTQYRIKIYNKAAQYNYPEPLIRIEFKAKKMDFTNSKGAKMTTLENFIKGQNIDFFSQLLLKYWNKVLVCPEGIIDIDKIKNPRTKTNFVNGLNSNYWTGLSAKTYIRRSNSFKDTIKQYSDIDLSKCISNMIIEKLIELNNPKKEQKGINDPYIDSQIIPFTKNNIRVCQTCGRDISFQKLSSKYCSEKYYGKEAKKCRNKQSNPRNNRIRKEKRMYPSITLFPVYIHYGFI